MKAGEEGGVRAKLGEGNGVGGGGGLGEVVGKDLLRGGEGGEGGEEGRISSGTEEFGESGGRWEGRVRNMGAMRDVWINVGLLCH